MTEESIWVKRGAGISAFGMPLIVMTAGSPGQQHWRGEYFIFLGGRNPAYLAQASTLKAEDVPPDIVTLDAQYMRIELDQQVSAQLSVHCFDLYEKTNKEGFLRNLELVEGDKLDILRAWLRDEYHEYIQRMYGHTQIDALKTFLKDVVHLGTLTQSA